MFEFASYVNLVQDDFSFFFFLFLNKEIESRQGGCRKNVRSISISFFSTFD